MILMLTLLPRHYADDDADFLCCRRRHAPFLLRRADFDDVDGRCRLMPRQRYATP